MRSRAGRQPGTRRAEPNTWRWALLSAACVVLLDGVPALAAAPAVAASTTAASTMAASTAAVSTTAADTIPRLGRPISAAEAATAGSTIQADGRGLPPGGGTAVTGKAVFAQHCARCHGEGGRGGSAPELVGGTAPLTAKRPDKTIGLYWPSAPMLFDFNWHAMPMDKPGSLSADDAYAVTAYLLFAEGLVGETVRIDARTLPAVRMPNRNGFRWVDAPQPPAVR